MLTPLRFVVTESLRICVQDIFELFVKAKSKTLKRELSYTSLTQYTDNELHELATLHLLMEGICERFSRNPDMNCMTFS